MSGTPSIYIDADACPVKDETFRVAARYGLHVYVVANSFLQVPREPWIERVIVSDGFDAADDWIAERAGPADASRRTACPVSKIPALAADLIRGPPVA